MVQSRPASAKRQSLSIQGLDELVERIVNVNKSINKEEFSHFFELANSVLKNQRFTSTNDHEVRRKYTRLIEKFRINSLENHGEILQFKLDQLFREDISKEEDLLLFDILSLLLSVSESPTRNRAVPYQSVVPPVSEPPAELGWKEILAEEPLVGEHWDSYDSVSDVDSDYSNDGEYDVQDLVDTENEAPRRAPDRKMNGFVLDESSRSSETHNLKLLHQLKQKQYWTKEPEVNSEPSDISFSLHNPLSLTPSLLDRSRLVTNLERIPFRSPLWMTELQILRETLYMLTARTSLLYSKNGDKVTVNLGHGTLSHVTVATLERLLDEYADFGSAIAKLNDMMACIETSARLSALPTLKAFRKSILEYLRRFNEVLSEYEITLQDCIQRRKKPADHRIASFLTFHEVIRHHRDFIVDLLDFVTSLPISFEADIGSPDAAINHAPANIVTALFNDIYSKIVLLQSSADCRNYLEWCSIFMHTIEPYLRTLERWMIEGIVDEKMGGEEFFVKREPEVEVLSSDYWCHGHRLRTLQVDIEVASNEMKAKMKVVPIFLIDFIDQIFQIGKSVRLFREVHHCQEGTGVTSKLFSNATFFNMSESLYETFLATCMGQLTVKVISMNPIAQEHNVSQLDRDFETLDKDISENSSKDPIGGDFNCLKLLYGKCVDAHLGKRSMKQCNDANPRRFVLSEMENLSSVALHTPFPLALHSTFKSLLAPLQLETSRILISTLENTFNLKRHLNNLRRLYFMEDGHSWSVLCHQLFQKMKERKKYWWDVLLGNSLWNECLGAMVGNGEHSFGFGSSDAWRVKTWINDIEETEKSSKWIDSWVVDYELPVALTIIITPSQLKIYNQVTRLLLKIKQSKFLLNDERYLKVRRLESQIEIKSQFKIQEEKITQLKKCWHLRWKLLCVVNAIEAYVLTTVLHTESHRVMEQIAETNDIEALIQLHNQYIRDIRDKCFLNEKTSPLYHSLLTLLNFTTEFTATFDHFLSSQVITSKTSLQTIQITKKIKKKLNTIEDEVNRLIRFLKDALVVLTSKSGREYLETLLFDLTT